MGAGPSTQGEIPAIGVQEKIGSITGDVPGVSRRQKNWTGHRAPIALGGGVAIAVQQWLVVGVFQDPGECLEKPLDQVVVGAFQDMVWENPPLREFDLC